MKSSLKLMDEVHEFLNAMEKPNGVRFIAGYMHRMEKALSQAEKEELDGAVWCKGGILRREDEDTRGEGEMSNSPICDDIQHLERDIFEVSNRYVGRILSDVLVDECREAIKKKIEDAGLNAKNILVGPIREGAWTVRFDLPMRVDFGIRGPNHLGGGG